MGAKAVWGKAVFGAALAAALAIPAGAEAAFTTPLDVPTTASHERRHSESSQTQSDETQSITRRLASITESTRDIQAIVNAGSAPESYCRRPDLEAAVDRLSDDIVWIDMTLKNLPEGDLSRPFLADVRKKAAKAYAATVLHCAWGHDAYGESIDARKVLSATQAAAILTEENAVVDARQPVIESTDVPGGSSAHSSI